MGARTPIPLDLAAELERNVVNALAEDIGGGDLSAMLVPSGHVSRGAVVSRGAAVLCGSHWFDACFFRLDANAKIVWHAQDGARITAGQTLCEVRADTRSLLSAERTALNFLQLLSGTATVTRRFVDTIAGTRARIVDTRKTLPGLRLAQKYAVRCGGGSNNRLGLYDGILIKENHILAAGGIAAALQRSQQLAHDGVFIQVEVKNLDQLSEALECGAAMILLEDMGVEEMRSAVALCDGRASLEASGGIDLERVRAIAEAGVDRISVGGLTKDVRAVDLSLRHVES